MIFPTRQIIGYAAITLIVAAMVFLWSRRWKTPNLPFEDHFAKKQIKDWTPYGGAWRLEDNVIVARSTERGSKLAAGSPSWSDYQVTADVQLRGHGGDAGIAIRVTEPQIGIDTYKGYFIGLQSDDSSIVMGRSDGHWLSIAPVHMEGGVRTEDWFRLHIVAVGCTVRVQVINLQTGNISTAGMRDAQRSCLRNGSIALRTTNSISAWRRIRVAAASESDLFQTRADSVSMESPSYPVREREWSAMRDRYLAEVPKRDISAFIVDGSSGNAATQIRTPPIHIDQLRPRLWIDAQVTIAGVVTSDGPIFVQDETGGIRVEPTPGLTLQTGDEVEILGRPVLKNGSLSLMPLNSRILWNRASVLPISVNGTQAVAGRYESRLVELDGVVRNRTELNNGTVDIQLNDGAQNFVARVPSNLFSASVLQIEIGSHIRVRGIVSTSDVQPHTTLAFILFARAPSDITVLSGPPWWTGQRLALVIALCFVVALAGVYLFVAVERSRLRSIYAERERISHDMHDTLAQSLAGVGFKLQGIRRSMRESGTVPRGIIEEMDTTCTLVSGTHREASASIAALHPASQKDGDLLTLLERSVYSMLDGDGIAVSISRIGESRNLSPVVADALFRIGREAIANALRHSRASVLELRLIHRSRDLILSVTDNGVGFDHKEHPSGFGLQSMQRRCEDIRATMEIESEPDSGCSVRITAPYRAHRILFRWIG